ncbi:dienelactone hydrolase [Okibacterium sp. HSC-33S16]|uniref:alpha/beta hydrolase n=1 Tax=Okibacterium sp. HSC-33S16 TaxID=2910965 RepID=UPI0020A0400E|nr:alpha/beta hydrolase [Okibacterium sp. HSC-33S16]MCP2030478.1 dienelactone hydrolase [Okibacterium sp. HSC-33S16]
MTIAARIRTVVLWALAFVVLAVLAALMWAHTVMAGDREAALTVWRTDALSITDTGHSVILAPTSGSSDHGLVFVPGARVDPYAYLFKLSGIAEAGTTVVITKPTLNLALADLRPLETFTDDVPDVDSWVVGGHSLGGVKACQYATDDRVDGLLLFGSYCASDLSGSGLPALSFVGENDGLSTPEKIADAGGNLPETATVREIPGANHANFGNYGAQAGDGESTANDAAVQRMITEEYAAWAATLPS